MNCGAPLAGRSVLVTRSRHQALPLVELLEYLGAQVIASPVIDQVDPPDLGPARAAAEAVRSYDWVVFTSTNAVDRFLAVLDESAAGSAALADRDAESPTLPRVAAVGRATADRLRARGVSVDLVPTEFRAEGLIEAFRDLGAGPGWRVLLPRAASAREILPDTLRELGVLVEVVPVYATVPAEPDPELLGALADGSIDVVTFTSPSTVRSLMTSLEHAGADPVVLLGRTVNASIGPVTSDELRAAGLEVGVEAEESSVPGLVGAIAQYFERAV